MPSTSNEKHSLWDDDPTAWLAAIVESSDDAIIGKTLDSTIRSWNTGAERIFGYAANEIIGRSVLTLIPPELHGDELMIVDLLARGERIEHFETVRVCKDGQQIEVSISVSPIRDAQGNVVGAAKIARDITEAKRLRKAEKELSAQLQEQAVELEQQIEEAQSLQEELEQTNEELHRALERSRVDQEAAEVANRAKGHFLATMSHELRTPLNAIAGYVDLLDLELRGPLTEQQRTDLDRIRHNQRTLLRLIDNVLDFAKLESGRQEFRVENIAIDDLLRTLETFITPALVKKHIAYRFESCGSDVVARADRDKVEQIMLNLLSNAVKFTNDGEIVVRCRSADWVEIDVMDSGRGIDPKLLDTIFEPFVQGEQKLTRTVEGTGLGLSISRALARGMGGDVIATSAPAHGSTFTLVLPKANTS
ncbi:MAG TPA: PAS domain-containing sensor histidine kinase [Gemmatimonadaceae bacterium]|nr:PAS domain-containing sensor histidine kinase [Gemmatimonadaceae bacterium]